MQFPIRFYGNPLRIEWEKWITVLTYTDYTFRKHRFCLGEHLDVFPKLESETL